MEKKKCKERARLSSKGGPNAPFPETPHSAHHNQHQHQQRTEVPKRQGQSAQSVERPHHNQQHHHRQQRGFKDKLRDSSVLEAMAVRREAEKGVEKEQSTERASILKKEEQDAGPADSPHHYQQHHRYEQQHAGASSPIKWKKVVYGGMQPGFEDNHTDASFLEAMVMNANVVKRDTWTAIRDSVAISQYVCVVAMVAAVWTYSLNGVLDSSLLLILDTVLLLFGFVVLLLTTGSISLAILYRYALYFTYFVSGLYVLAPVFQTLTSSISSDSIWALTVCLLMVHLCFHDYIDSSTRPPPAFTTSRGSKSNDLSGKLAVKKPATLSGNVSLNASIVASVLIASRLPSGLLVFALMLFSSEFFLLFPLVTRCIKQYSVKVHLWFSCMLILVTMGLIFPLNRLALVLFVAVVIFIMLVCPYWLIRIQEYKFEINGPWDEAKLCFDLD